MKLWPNVKRCQLSSRLLEHFSVHLVSSIRLSGQFTLMMNLIVSHSDLTQTASCQLSPYKCHAKHQFWKFFENSCVQIVTKSGCDGLYNAFKTF